MITADKRSLLERLAATERGFPRVTDVSDDALLTRLTLDVSPELCWLAGHFPDQPILPGIVQLHWATLVCRVLYSFADTPREIKRLKFRKIVVPPHSIKLTVSRQGEREATFRFTSRRDAHSHGTIVFPEPG